MILTLILATLGIASAQAPVLSCKAIYRTIDDNQKSIEENAPLKVAFSGAGATRYEAELEGKFFSVVADNAEDLLVQITTAPNYTKGSVSKGRLDSQGRYSLAEVNGATVHRLECRKTER
ncbi:MAG: hypothetical protein ACXVBL_19005 [Bdellovibrionota bacterium]